MPAMATANIVIVSAKRLIEERQRWRVSSSIEEIIVPPLADRDPPDVARDGEAPDDDAVHAPDADADS